jgi:hypothetical protein
MRHGPKWAQNAVQRTRRASPFFSASIDEVSSFGFQFGVSVNEASGTTRHVGAHIAAHADTFVED